MRLTCATFARARTLARRRTVLLLLCTALAALLGTFCTGVPSADGSPAQPPQPVRLTWPPFPSRPASSLSPHAQPGPVPSAATAGAAEAPFAGLVSFCFGEKFAEMGNMATLNHNAYAARHGYDFIKAGRVLRASTRPTLNILWLHRASLWAIILYARRAPISVRVLVRLMTPLQGLRRDDAPHALHGADRVAQGRAWPDH